MNLTMQAQLTPEDYLEAQRLHIGNTVFVIAAIAMALAILGLLWAFSVGNYLVWLGGVVAFFLWFFIFRWRFERSLTRRLKKKFEQQKDLQLPCFLEITDERMRMGAPGRGEWMIPWSDFIKWRANERVIAAYTNDALFRIFPRRWFSSEADYASFKEFLTKTVGPVGKTRKISA